MLTPNGPAADIGLLWSGGSLCDLAAIRQPTLLVRGAWDSLCDDADAAAWRARLGAAMKPDVVVPEGTHLLHLERGRHALHAVVNRFLAEAAA